MSPRRSSRARSSNTNPAPPSQTASSNSTSTLKNTRIDQRSASVEDQPEDIESQATEPAMQPRRSRRNGVEDTPKDSTQKKEEEEDEEGEGNVDEESIEEEITRCICGQTEYPGPSDTIRQMVKGQPLEALGDELGSFFVCCDQCSVWQHGGCVGLTNEDTLPDQYYCEECKPELHKIIKGTNGAKASLYRPVFDAEHSSRSSSTSSQQRKNSKGSKSNEPAKRRATMNSRGAYDEDEMLRRAIEESKHDGTGSLGKRLRENVDGDEPKPAVKRQRTASWSDSSLRTRSISPGATGESRSKSRNNLRGAAARKTKEKEIREKLKADAAAAKAEAANRRNARSERRRGEDSPPPTPSLSPSKGPHVKTKATSTPNDPTPPSSTHTKKKTAVSRATANRRGRLGRNQYTRDREDTDTPMRDTSHDRNGNDHSPNGVQVNGHGNGNSNGMVGGSGKQSKAKTHPARTSMNEMKRRVAAILEFVGQMQTKASTNTSNSGKDTPNSNGSGKGQNLPVAGLVKAVQAAQKEVQDPADAGAKEGGEEKVSGDENSGLKLRDDGEFRTLGSTDMMETLTKELVSWQSVYGVWSR